MRAPPPPPSWNGKVRREARGAPRAGCRGRAPTPSLFAAAALTVAGLSGCGGDGEVVRDAPGAPIVENAAPSEGTPLWSLADSADLVIGTQAGDELFTLHQVGHARFLSGGKILVWNGWHHYLWFDSEGKFLRRGGGRGEGPSESLTSYQPEIADGDTMIVVSRRPPKILVFGPEGSFARSVALPANAPSVKGLQLLRLGAGGWAGLHHGGDSPEEGGVSHEIWHVVRYTPELRPLDTLIALRAGMYEAGFHVEASPEAHFAAGGGVLVTGEGARYELKVFDAGGELLHVIRNSMPGPAALRAQERPRGDRPAPSPEFPEPVRPREPDPPKIESAPAFDGIVVANDGGVWVRRMAGPDAATVRGSAPRSNTVTGGTLSWFAAELNGQEWHIYDTAGKLVARARLPPRFRPTEIAGSKVLGVWKDELDVESVRVFRVIRG